MQLYKRLLVTLNLTDLDPAVVRYTNLVARLAQPSRIDFINIVNTKQLPDALIAARPNLLQAAAKRNKRALRELVRQHLRVPSSCEVEIQVRRGSPVESILAHARSMEPDLLIVGRDPKNARSGTVPERLGATAPCSVLVVPRAAPPVLRAVLGGIDFSTHSRSVLKQAIALGRAAELNTVYGLHVCDVPDGLRGNGLTPEELEAQITNHVDNSWQKLLSRIEPDGMKLIPLTRRGGFPTLVIKEEVRRSGFELLIIAARGRSAARNVFLGSVSQRVINATETPLLVLKSKRDSAGLLGAMLELQGRTPSPV